MAEPLRTWGDECVGTGVLGLQRLEMRVLSEWHLAQLPPSTCQYFSAKVFIFSADLLVLQGCDKRRFLCDPLWLNAVAVVHRKDCVKFQTCCPKQQSSQRLHLGTTIKSIVVFLSFWEGFSVVLFACSK